ncbi:hypothetical protein EYF80_059251 [Liparis tanakae]|uniref:Uncharacterized protein n=1 Tax=Liparis tanakae TaxID=230148 RepID=A0A4Z2EP81_9TELE|nr:hypothetical protein EYF80_059251 [Liparis tanakae]
MGAGVLRRSQPASAGRCRVSSRPTDAGQRDTCTPLYINTLTDLWRAYSLRPALLPGNGRRVEHRPATRGAGYFCSAEGRKAGSLFTPLVIHQLARLQLAAVC